MGSSSRQVSLNGRETYLELVGAGVMKALAHPISTFSRASRLNSPTFQTTRVPSFSRLIFVLAPTWTLCVERTTSTPTTDLVGIHAATHTPCGTTYSRVAAARVFGQSSRGRSSVAGRGGGWILANKRHRGGSPHDLHGAYELAVRVPAADAVPPPGGLCRGGHAERPGGHR